MPCNKSNVSIQKLPPKNPLKSLSFSTIVILQLTTSGPPTICISECAGSLMVAGQKTTPTMPQGRLSPNTVATRSSGSLGVPQSPANRAPTMLSICQTTFKQSSKLLMPVLLKGLSVSLYSGTAQLGLPWGARLVACRQKKVTTRHL